MTGIELSLLALSILLMASILGFLALAGVIIFLAVRHRFSSRARRRSMLGAVACIVLAGSAFLIPRIITDTVIEPVGGISIESSSTAMNFTPHVPAQRGPLSTGGTVPVNSRPYDAAFFQDYGTNPFVDTEDGQPVHLRAGRGQRLLRRGAVLPSERAYAKTRPQSGPRSS